MLRFSVPLSIAALACLPALANAAAELPPDVLAKSSWVELTRADYEKAVSKVPENLRFEFSTSPKRVQTILNNLLVTKTLAAQARAHGTRPAASFEPGAGDDSDRALATAELQRIEADAGKSFDAQKAAFEMKARELYTLDRDKYVTPEEVRISDIAVSIKQRGDEAALARAREARQRIDAGADFAAVARDYSDDPTTRDKGGALPFVTAKALTPDYAKAVFALKTVGAISGPIQAPMLGAAVASAKLHRQPEFAALQDELKQKVLLARQVGAELGVHLIADDLTPIFMLPYESAPQARAAVRAFWDEGFYVCPVTYPAVPISNPGVRFTISRTNAPEDIRALMTAAQRLQAPRPAAVTNR